MKTRCPHCGDLVDIERTGRRRSPDKGTDEWYRVAKHPPTGEPCLGSGRHI